MSTLIVHGGAGAVPEDQRQDRQAAVERALDDGWARIADGALEAVLAAVRRLEDEPLLNAGIGATLNSDGKIEHDAGLMEGTQLRTGAAGAVTGIRHPIDLAAAILRDGRHALLAGEGAVRFARESGVELADHSIFMTERQRLRLDAARQPADTVGAVAMDGEGRLAVAVSTGGMWGKLPGRLGDAPLAGSGFYARDGWGGAVGTGHGEAFIRLVLCHHACVEMASGRGAQEVAGGAVAMLQDRLGASGGIILIDAAGVAAAAYNTPFMPWAQRHG